MAGSFLHSTNALLKLGNLHDTIQYDHALKADAADVVPLLCVCRLIAVHGIYSILGTKL